MVRASGSGLAILIIFMVIVGLAFFDQESVPQGNPPQDVPSQNNPSQNSPSQQRAANCAWLDNEDYVSLDRSSSLDDCASQLWVMLGERRDRQIFGIWQDTEMYVNSDGDVYTRRADSGDNWDYAGSLDTGSSNSNDAPRPTQPPAQPTRPASAQPHDPLTLDQIFQLAEDDINDFWSQQFQRAGSGYEQPQIVLYNRSRVSTACGTVSSQEGPLYCPNDHTAYFPRDFMEQELESVGDFSVVVVIAHEWGHAIQNLAGLYSDLSIETELQADCFAGAYSQYASSGSQRILLDDGDIDEGATAFYLFGDPTGTDYFDEQAHGSGRQRYNAFEEGLQNGYTTCINQR